MDDPLKILVADDEEIVRHVLKMFLVRLGHTVHEAADGTEALQAIESQPFDLAVIDYRMPGLDGMQVIDKARALQPQLSTVLITGHGDDEMEEEAIKLGALGFLKKPFRIQDIEAIIAKRARPD